MTPDSRRRGRSIRKMRRLVALIEWGSMTVSVVAVSEAFVSLSLQLRDMTKITDKFVDRYSIASDGEVVDLESQPSFTSG